MSNVIFDLRKLPVYNGTKSLDGNSYRFRFHWNTVTEKWYMDMSAQSDDIDVDMKGRALLCGKDLIPPGYSDILGQLWMIDNSGLDEDPNYDDIGSRWTLEYIPLADV